MSPGLDIFSILIVCTGNVCRSPIAEQLLRDRLSSAAVTVTIGSAGTRALVGQPMTPEAAEQVSEHGTTPSPHRARQLTAEHVEAADLILTASRDHRGEVVSVAPSASRRTFTLREFARIVEFTGARESIGPGSPDVEAESLRTVLRAFVDTMAASRGYAPPPARAIDDDIDDPYRQSKQVYRRSAGIIHEAVTTIAAGLASARGRA
ncbi:MAG TPA: low molecular weight phosphatase family protein [Glaciibacter sp.]|nr:low molecular weight phosphatase family protein [Glaciibacter sp.]